MTDRLADDAGQAASHGVMNLSTPVALASAAAVAAAVLELSAYSADPGAAICSGTVRLS